MGDISANFDRHEFACKCGCGFDTVDTELLVHLEEIRQHFDRRVTITSGCRCVAHNRDVGGSVNSQHRFSRAADIVVDDIMPHEVADYAESISVPGVGRYDTFTHIDSRVGYARWGD